MAIATYIDPLRRCIVWPSRLRGGDNSSLRRLTPEYAGRAAIVPVLGAGSGLASAATPPLGKDVRAAGETRAAENAAT